MPRLSLVLVRTRPGRPQAKGTEFLPAGIKEFGFLFLPSTCVFLILTSTHPHSHPNPMFSGQVAGRRVFDRGDQ